MGENENPENINSNGESNSVSKYAERDRKKYLKYKEKIKQQKINYYYENREKILKKAQNKRIEKAGIKRGCGRPAKYIDIVPENEKISTETPADIITPTNVT